MDVVYLIVGYRISCHRLRINIKISRNGDSIEVKGLTFPLYSEGILVNYTIYLY